MRPGARRKLDGDPEDCAPDHEKPGARRNSRIVGTVCALEQVRHPGRRELARLAGVQHGCSRRQQILAAGLGRGALDHRLKTQRYLLLHRAVYLIDPALADEWTATMAGVLLFAGDALATHRSAGAAWGMLEQIPSEPELTLVGRSTHCIPGLTIHRTTGLEQRDVRWRRGLPVTSPARTVLDLAGTLGALELEDVLAVAQRQRLCSMEQIREAIERAPAKRPGVATLRTLLDQGGFARTRSHYERKLLDLITQAGLPRPLTNHRVAGFEVDMVWLDRKLVVEFDGRKFHSDRRAFENDRRRDQHLVAAGYRVIRITARQIEREPYGVIARLAAALA